MLDDMSEKVIRVLWIDYVRDLGMWAVVLGHSFCSDELKQYIYSFHMPLFFVLSGIFWKKERYMDFIFHKFKTLIIPYLIFNLLFYCFDLLGIVCLFPNNIIWYEPLVSIFLGYGSLCCHASWFIICLFVVENIYYGLKKIEHGYFIVLLLLSAFSFYFIPFVKFWNLSVALVGIVFYGIGQIGSNYIYKLANAKTCLISFYPIYINGRVDMAFNIYGNYYYLFIFNALLGCISVLCLGVILNRIIGSAGGSVITYVSKNLILILLLHPFMHSLIYKFYLQSDDLLNMITSFMSIIFLIPIIYLVNRLCPWILGRHISASKMRLD